MKNIFVIGAQSTGKTTIVNTVEQQILTQHESPLSIACQQQKPTFIREVARNVLISYHFSREDITTSPQRAFQLQKHILDAQFEAEDAASRQLPNWYVTDRSGLDPIVYASMFVGEAAASELLASKEWSHLEQKMKEGMVFLCEAGTPWLVDDGTRLMPKDENAWLEVDRAFRRLLNARKIDYSVIPNHLHDIGARAAMVVEALLGTVAE